MSSFDYSQPSRPQRTRAHNESADRDSQPSPTSGRLTRREIECVQLAGLRLSNGEIADALGIAVSTVANNLRSANAKLGTGHRMAAARALGIQYPGAGLTNAKLEELVSGYRHPVSTPGVGTEADRLPWAARHWRPVPSDALVRVAIIFGVLLLWLLALGGGITVVKSVFEALEGWRPS